MKPTNNFCIQCEAIGKKRKKRATHWVKEVNQVIPLCDSCYEEYLAEEDYFISLKEENDGSILQESEDN